MGHIEVLVVDDSLLMQRVLTDVLQSDKHIVVVGTARNGEEALQKISNLRPDVVTMDIEMPKMDGLTAVRKIMETNPTPIVMISALTQREALIALKALEYGAVDYVAKPSGQISLNMDSVRDELVHKVKTAVFANLSINKQTSTEVLHGTANSNNKIISIAASTGGPPALTKILCAMPADSPPILIVQHMPKGITNLFAKRLNEVCMFPVKEAQEGDLVQERLALIAPGGYHMAVTKDSRIHLTLAEPVNFVRPSADVLMYSLAEIYRDRNVGVVLTGMGSDGAKGLVAIKEQGGFTIAQDQKSSIVYGMPHVAVQTGCVDKVASLTSIPAEILKACDT